MKNKNRGGEPGIDSHMISWHNDVTAIIAKVVTHSCSHVIGGFEQLQYLLLKKWAVIDFVGETTAQLKQQRRRSIQCQVRLSIYCCHVLLWKLLTRTYEEGLYGCLVLHSAHKINSQPYQHTYTTKKQVVVTNFWPQSILRGCFAVFTWVTFMII